MPDWHAVSKVKKALSSASFSAEPTHRLRLLFSTNLRLLLLALNLCSGRWPGFGLASGLALAIGLKGLEPARVGLSSRKAGQLVEEFMGRFREQRLSLMLARGV